MLDQNTDRMWYVIGAVLVGAAIILIANGTLPQMFASVTESFDDIVEESSSIVSDIEMNGAIYQVEDINLTNLSRSQLDNYTSSLLTSHNMKYYKIPVSGKVQHDAMVKITFKVSDIGEDLEHIGFYVHPTTAWGTDHVTRIKTVNRNQLDSNGEYSFYTKWENKNDLSHQQVRLDNVPSRQRYDADFRLDELSIQRVID